VEWTLVILSCWSISIVIGAQECVTDSWTVQQQLKTVLVHSYCTSAHLLCVVVVIRRCDIQLRCGCRTNCYLLYFGWH